MNAHDKWLESAYDLAAAEEEARKAAVIAEADAIMAECAASMEYAINFADYWEALAEDRAVIIWNVCAAMDLYRKQGDKADALGALYTFATIGRRVFALVQQAAMQRAERTMQVSA